MTLRKRGRVGLRRHPAKVLCGVTCTESSNLSVSDFKSLLPLGRRLFIVIWVGIWTPTKPGFVLRIRARTSWGWSTFAIGLSPRSKMRNCRYTRVSKKSLRFRIKSLLPLGISSLFWTWKRDENSVMRTTQNNLSV